MSLVSVIIPTYGASEHVNKTIESALNQDYKNIEVIVVDDNGKGSKNQIDTQLILEKHMLNKQFKYIIHDENKNGSAARNTGASYANGTYLNFIDDDDCFMPGKIKKQVNQLETSGEEWGASYSSRITKFEGEVSKITKAKRSGSILYDYMMHRITIGTGSMLLRKSIWEECGGFDESFLRHQDWEFVARVLDKYKVKSAESVYFERNFTGRYGPKSPEESEEYMDHYISKMEIGLNNLTPFEWKNIRVNNYIGISLKYLRQRKIRKSIRVFKDNGEGFLGIFYILRNSLKYIKDNINGKKYT